MEARDQEIARLQLMEFEKWLAQNDMANFATE